MNKKKYVEEHLFEDMVEAACREWDAHVLDLEDIDQEILTAGDWETTDDPVILKKIYTFEPSGCYDEDGNEVCDIQEDTFYVQFKNNSAEILDHYTDSE